MKKGKLYGIGVGPGDSGLMTVKAVRLVKEADLIITPKTEKKEGSVAWNIAAPYIPETAEVLPMVFPMVTDPSVLKAQWKENAALIAEKLDKGKNVVFLTLGDPMLYSTYMYIFHAFEGSGYDIETIPGIPAFLAIASYLNMPVAEWEETAVILPATADPEKIDKVLSVADHAVIMKVYKSWPFIQKMLRKHGMIHSSVMISRAGLPDEIVLRDLDQVPADYKPNYLSTILARRDRES